VLLSINISVIVCLIITYMQWYKKDIEQQKERRKVGTQENATYASS